MGHGGFSIQVAYGAMCPYFTLPTILRIQSLRLTLWTLAPLPTETCIIYQHEGFKILKDFKDIQLGIIAMLVPPGTPLEINWSHPWRASAAGRGHKILDVE